MNQDRDFLNALAANPKDDGPWLVYADWLDERGDPRGEYLRLIVRLASLPEGDGEGPVLRRRMIALYPRLPREWRGQLEQPPLFRAGPAPFPPAWWSIDLPGHRPTDATYQRFPYSLQPPLPVESFQGNFRWLREGPQVGEGQPTPEETDIWQNDVRGGAARVNEEAERLGHLLPREFLAFVGDVDLRERVRSCTDCFFNHPRRLVPSPAGEGGHLARFCSDSQGCLHWYLYLNRGYHCVVVSGGFYGGHPDYDEIEDEEEGETAFCAPSFESFIYRFWIENEIWYALHDHTPLTPEQHAYLGHFAGKQP